HLDGNRILAGNEDGGIYQFVVPLATPSADETRSLPPSHQFDSSAAIWLIRPSHVTSVSASFTTVTPTPTLSASGALRKSSTVESLGSVRASSSFSAAIPSARASPPSSRPTSTSVSRAQSFDSLPPRHSRQGSRSSIGEPPSTELAVP